jgi:hypothetical protein
MRKITFPNSRLSLSGVFLVLTGIGLTACGSAIVPLRPLPAPVVRQAALADPAAPDPAPADYLPLHVGQAWHYTNVGPENRLETRTETIIQLLERPARDGTGTMTVAEIERVETGKGRHRFTIERYSNGLVRSYEPALPKLGTPILAAKSDKQQEWGYNPGHGATGYFGILQWPGASSVTVGTKPYADCLKVVLSTSGVGFPAFRREIIWAPGVGAVRLTEGDPSHRPRVFELVTAK